MLVELIVSIFDGVFFGLMASDGRVFSFDERRSNVGNDCSSFADDVDEDFFFNVHKQQKSDAELPLFFFFDFDDSFPMILSADQMNI